MPVRDALDRVLGEDVASPLALPPWDNSSMDGYAVRAADLRGATAANPVALPVAGTVAAGAVESQLLGVGQAIRIMTGAPIPAGADSVVRVEDTDGGTVTVRIRSDRDAGRNVRPRGEDVTKGAIVATRGTRIGPALVGLLASIGRDAVQVFRRPRVAVLASGDELVDLDRFDEVLAGRKIVSSNSYTLQAALRRDGTEPMLLGIARDDPDEMAQRLRSCDADMLLTIGGVSVGAHDHTRSVVSALGARMEFWRASIRPGAPIGFGMLGAMPWLGLPGNPVSALVTYELFARPALRKLQGYRLVHRQPVPVTVEEPITISAPLTHFLRAIVRVTPAGYVASLTGPQGSGILSSMAAANALLIVPPETPRIDAGRVAMALLLDETACHSDTFPV